jgi:beta-lactamase class A
MESQRAGETSTEPIVQNARIPGKRRGRIWYAFEVKLVPTLALFVLLVVAVVGGYRFNTDVTTVASASVANKRLVVTNAPPPVADSDSLPTLEADMQAVIAAQTSVSASATLIDLATGKAYNAGNYNQNFEAASTSKLVAVFDYMHQVELGKATLSKSIQGQSAQDIIMRMIVYSDNDAWTKLNTYLQMRQEQQYVNSLGLTGTIIQENNIQFSTPNMARLLQMLYEGKLMNTEHQKLVYDYMSHTTMNKLIPAALPADAVVYHKYGQIDGVLHDAAIVEYQGHKFVLVVYTNNAAGTSGQNAVQTQLIHAITTAAFADITKP